jgi:hypothetical protein
MSNTTEDSGGCLEFLFKAIRFAVAAIIIWYIVFFIGFYLILSGYSYRTVPCTYGMCNYKGRLYMSGPEYQSWRKAYKLNGHDPLDKTQSLLRKISTKAVPHGEGEGALVGLALMIGSILQGQQFFEQADQLVCDSDGGFFVQPTVGNWLLPTITASCY